MHASRRVGRAGHTGGAKGSRGPRGAGKREKIYRLVAGANGGMWRADVIKKVEHERDNLGETSVSNARSALKKAGRLSSGARVKYRTE